LALSVPDDG